jgi:hypothetical protein
MLMTRTDTHQPNESIRKTSRTTLFVDLGFHRPALSS